MPTIAAVLFDYGMVLSAPPLASAWDRMKALTGLDEAGLHAGYWEYRHAYDRGTHSGVEYWHLVAAHAGRTVSESQVAQLIAADNDLWTDLNTPMLAWAQQLQRAGVRTGILSNLGDEMHLGLVRRFDWVKGFDHCTWSHELKLAKPELAIYRHAVAGLGVPAESVLFIDDKAENIAAAVDAGLQGIQYTTHAAFEQEMVERSLGSLLHPENATS